MSWKKVPLVNFAQNHPVNFAQSHPSKPWGSSGFSCGFRTFPSGHFQFSEAGCAVNFYHVLKNTAEMSVGGGEGITTCKNLSCSCILWFHSQLHSNQHLQWDCNWSCDPIFIAIKVEGGEHAGPGQSRRVVPRRGGLM